MNRLAQVTDETGSIIKKNTYDVKGQLIRTTDAEGYNTEIIYDIGGRISTTTTPESKINGETTTKYTYDALNNIRP
jgi:YD repeat-containing protein